MSDIGFLNDWDLLILALYPTYFASLILLVPLLSILHRAGRSKAWVLLLLVPLVGWMIAPWAVAFIRWSRPTEAGETLH